MVVIACVSALTWFVVLPEYRPSLQKGEHYGIDVSSHQGEIDWPKVADDNIDFAYVKASEGGDFKDRRFAANWAAAKRAGIDRGAYHFFTLCTSGIAQARHFVGSVGDPGELPPAIDLELAGNCKQRPKRDVLVRELTVFIAAVEALFDEEVVLYVGDDFDRCYDVRRAFDRDLWHFRFLRRPDVEPWQVWQVTGFAHVKGVKGRVDLDIMRG